MVRPARTVDGYVFEYEAIARWFQRHNTSPMTNMQLPSLVLTEDRALCAAIEEFALREFFGVAISYHSHP